jgi:hypothetical protein
LNLRNRHAIKPPPCPGGGLPMKSRNRHVACLQLSNIYILPPLKWRSDSLGYLPLDPRPTRNSIYLPSLKQIITFPAMS